MLDRDIPLADRIADAERALRERYGELINLNVLAELLKFPSVAAARKARERGRLPVRVAQLPHRRGWYTTPRAVAEVLARLDVATQASEDSPMS